MAGYDVLVIGAGPAGSSAALHAAQLGLSTVVLEEHDAVGRPRHCGECLSLVALRRLNLDPPRQVMSLRVQGVRIVFPNRDSHTVSEPGVVLNKDRFEQWLAEQAVAAGAKLQLHSHVTAMERSENSWRITASNGDVFQARVVIDASGAAAVSSTLLGLNPPLETRLGLQYELRDLHYDGFINFYLWPECCRSGYLWMIPKSNGRANVGLITSERNSARQYLQSFLQQMGWQDKPRGEVFGGREPSEGPVPRTFADGLLLTGDAAGFPSPVFGGGTHLGMVSGKWAAETVADALQRGDCSAARLAAYQRRWKSTFPNYAMLLKGRRALEALSAAELDLLGCLLPDELGSVNLAQRLLLGCKLLCRPRIAAKGALSVLLALDYSRAQYYGW